MQGRQDAKDQLIAEKNGFNGFVTLSEWRQNTDEVQSLFGSFGEYFRSKLHAALNLD